MHTINHDKNFKHTNDNKSIVNIINERLLLKPLKIELPTIEEKYAQIVKSNEHGAAVHFKDFVPPNGPILLTGFINNHYTELEIKINKVIQESLFVCNINYLRVSTQRRIEPRFNITDCSQFYAKRVKISKNELDIKGTSIPTAYKVILDRYRVSKSGMGDKFNISTFGNTSGIYKKIAKTGKSLFVPNINDVSSFVKDEETNKELIDIKEHYGLSFETERTKLIKDNIAGWIICPILGPIGADMRYPLGYIEIKSRSPLDMFKLMEVKSLSYEIVEKLRDVTMLEVIEKQRVLDVSRSGIRLLIDNKDLINAMLRRTQFTFDIIIKGQAPITVMGWIRKARLMENGSLQVGVKIQGESNRQDQMLRYQEFVTVLERTSV
jgi:hypothetical protein